MKSINFVQEQLEAESLEAKPMEKTRDPAVKG